MQYHTVAEVATMLSVSQETVKRWLRQGKMRGSILGDRAGWRIPDEEIKRFMDDRKPTDADRQPPEE